MTNDVAQFKSGGLANIARMTSSLANLANSALQGANSLQGRMLLKLDKGTGQWIYGQESLPLDSAIVVDPDSFQHGVIAWGLKRDILGERMVPITEPMPDTVGLPPGDYDTQISFNCAIPATNTQLLYKTTAAGGKEFIGDLARAIVSHCEADPEHKIAEIELHNSSYQHRSWGRIYKPQFRVIGWRSAEGAERLAERADPAQGQLVDEPAQEAEKPAKRRRTRVEV